MAKIIKIYGERNTGTNYLERLIELNLDAEVLPGVVPYRLDKFIRGNETAKDLYFWMTYRRNLGWKHALVAAETIKKQPIYSENLAVLTITKNPYSWLLSLYRNPYQLYPKVRSFHEFLLAPCHTVGRENFSGNFENPVVLWNQKNDAYLRLGNDIPCRNLRYEDLLGDPEGVVQKVSTAFFVRKRHDEFINLEESAKKSSNKGFAYYRNYYLNEEWKQELDKTAIETINRFLDPTIVRKFGYVLLKDEPALCSSR